MNREEVGKVLTRLSYYYPNFHVSPELMAVWHELLRDKDYGLVCAAIKELLREEAFKIFAPTAPSIIQKIEAMESAKSGAGEPPVCVFYRGPERAKEGLEVRAWNTWGGIRRWGQLPDTKAPHIDPGGAHFRWESAKKDFIAIYESLLTRAKNEDLWIKLEHRENHGELHQERKVLRPLLAGGSGFSEGAPPKKRYAHGADTRESSGQGDNKRAPVVIQDGIHCRPAR